MPVEALLDGYQPPLLEIAERLRQIVMEAAPDAVERVRPGWKLIGYDLPIRRNGVFFAWIWPEGLHVHLGFPHGDLMDDPAGPSMGRGSRSSALAHLRGRLEHRRAAREIARPGGGSRVAMVPRSVFLRGGVWPRPPGCRGPCRRDPRRPVRIGVDRGAKGPIGHRADRSARGSRE